jgi:hypothetical protein
MPAWRSFSGFAALGLDLLGFSVIWPAGHLAIFSRAWAGGIKALGGDSSASQLTTVRISCDHFLRMEGHPVGSFQITVCSPACKSLLVPYSTSEQGMEHQVSPQSHKGHKENEDRRLRIEDGESGTILPFSILYPRTSNLVFFVFFVPLWWVFNRDNSRR